MQGREPAHRQADDVRLVDLQAVEHAADVVAGARLGIAGRVLRHLGGRPASRIEGDATVAPREIAHLRLPAAIVACELVHEDDRRAAAGLLVIELDAVVGGKVGHWVLTSVAPLHAATGCRSYAYAAAFPLRSVCTTGRVIVKTAPDVSVRLPELMLPRMASMKPREIARPRPVPGAPGRPSGRDRTSRRCAPGRRRDAARPRREPACRRRQRRASSDADGGFGRRVLGRVVEQIEQDLLEQHGIHRHHRQIGRDVHFHVCLARILLARRIALPTISPTSCGVALGTTAPDSSLVISSRLAMNRFSRSASSMMVASRSALAASSSDFAMSRRAPAAPSTAASGVLRSWEIDVSSADRSRSVSDRALHPVDVLDQADALDRQRGLIDQGIQQAPLVRRQQRAWLVAVDPDDADRCRAPVASAGTATWRRAACRSRGPPARSFSQAHLAAARSASSSVSSGG